MRVLAIVTCWRTVVLRITSSETLRNFARTWGHRIGGKCFVLQATVCFAFLLAVARQVTFWRLSALTNANTFIFKPVAVVGSDL